MRWTNAFEVAAVVAVVCMGCMLAIRREREMLGEMERQLESPLTAFNLDRSLSVAVFGTSAAHGENLDNKYEAYPYLLSPTVDNYAHSGQNNLNYFSTCTETAIGDDKIYDVILLDYWLRYYQGLDHLVRKLRSRFPGSLIILIKTWNPTQFRRKNDDKKSKPYSFQQWKEMNKLMDRPLAQIVEALEKDTDGEWYFPENTNANQALKDIAEQWGAHEFSLPFVHGNVRETLIQYLSFYDEETHSKLNVYGHVALARNIKTFFDSLVPDPRNLIFARTFRGAWGKGDQCTLWYSNGIFNNLYSSSTLNMTKERYHNTTSAKEECYALEVTTAGWFDYNNPFMDERTLYVSFLLSKEANFYPRVLFHWDGKFAEVNPSVGRRSRTRTVAIGKIKPGNNRISVVPYDSNTTAPFELIGLTLTDEMALPREYGFGRTYERVGEDEDEVEDLVLKAAQEIESMQH